MKIRVWLHPWIQSCRSSHLGLSLLQSKASEQKGRVTTQRQPQLQAGANNGTAQTATSWRDFRSSYLPSSCHPKAFDTSLKLAWFPPSTNRHHVNWIGKVFCKRRKFEAHLKKNLEINHLTFSHIYWLCNHFQKIILKCQLSLGPSLTFRPQALSLSLTCAFTVVFFLQSLVKLVPTAILLPAVLSPWVHSWSHGTQTSCHCDPSAQKTPPQWSPYWPSHP